MSVEDGRRRDQNIRDLALGHSLGELRRAVEKQSRFDADITASLMRILRGEERGVARGRALFHFSYSR